MEIHKYINIPILTACTRSSTKQQHSSTSPEEIGTTVYTTIRRISKVNCKADDRQAKESEDWHVVPNPKAKIMTKIQGSLLDR